MKGGVAAKSRHDLLHRLRWTSSVACGEACAYEEAYMTDDAVADRAEA